MDKLANYLHQQSKLFLLIASLSLVALLGGLDYLTGPEIFVPIFHLIPVALAAWFGGWWIGVGIAIISALTGLSLDLLLRSPYSHPAIPYGNMLLRLSLFLIVTYMLVKLQLARHRREELLHFIAHDLQAPLGVIIPTLKLLQEDSYELNPTQQWLVKTAMSSSQWLSTLINSMLNLSRLESGYMPLHTDQVKVKELVQLSVEQVAWQVEQHRMTLITELDGDIESVCADRELTLRVLVNLLGNAVKFSPAGAVVTVRVMPTPANMLAFNVTDQGPGIPPEWVGKVFDKFVQVEARRAGVAVGSGLGLTFCKLAVEAQGGQIGLKSSPGQGTTVTFTLPVVPRPSTQVHPVNLLKKTT